MAESVPEPSNECEKCGHPLTSEDPTKGHREGEGVLICKECYEVCRQPGDVAPPAAPSVRPVQDTPGQARALAGDLVDRITKMRNEMIWGELQKVGVLIRGVDGGFHIANNRNQEAVRVTVEEALEKAREWLTPPV